MLQLAQSIYFFRDQMRVFYRRAEVHYLHGNLLAQQFVVPKVHGSKAALSELSLYVNEFHSDCMVEWLA